MSMMNDSTRNAAFIAALTSVSSVFGRYTIHDAPKKPGLFV